MEDDDEMVVVIVANENEKVADLPVLQCFEEDEEVIVKKELNEEFEYEYLEDAEFLEKLESMKEEVVDVKLENSVSVDNLVETQSSSSSDEEAAIQQSVHKRRKPLKPSEYKSFVAELRKQYPDLKTNVSRLVDALVEVMRGVKTPKLPEGFYEIVNKKYSCLYCEIVSVNRSAAGRHYQERHGTYYLVCYACGKEFRGTLYLYRHEMRCKAPDAQIVLRARAKSIGSKARGRPYIQPVVPVAKLKRVPCLKCSECTATFCTKPALEAHENLHRGLRPYRCDLCPNAYTSAHVLYRHKKIHNNDSFICDHCGRSFRMKNVLIQHMDTHRATKRFQCEDCGRPFAHKAAMVRHVDKVHRLLPPPCVCEVCHKRYMRMSALKIHMQKAHGMELVSRNMFVKALPKMSDTEVLNVLKLQ